MSVWFAAVPTIKLNEIGVIASAGVGPIVKVKGKGAEEVDVESVTVAVPVIVAVARGVPVMVTVLPLPAAKSTAACTSATTLFARSASRCKR